MKKKILFFVIFVFMSLGQGCRTEHYLIIDIDFNAVSIEKNTNGSFYVRTSSIKDKLMFIISYRTERVYAYAPLGNVCYALTLPTAIDNSLLRNTFSITFDKTFIYNGNTILAMTNIFEIDAISKEINEFETNNPPWEIGLEFSDVFFKNSVFDISEEYAVTFSCETTDNNFFEKTTIIKFEN